MSSAVIFLDMDGVLSTPRAFVVQRTRKRARDDKWIDPVAVLYLDDLCRASGAEIVVSSTWRLTHSKRKFAAMLKRHGFTGRLHKDWRTGQSRDGFRGHEVNDWLNRHPEVEHHLILDDDGDFYPGAPLVQTDTRNGLLHEHAVAARAIIAKWPAPPLPRRGGGAG